MPPKIKATGLVLAAIGGVAGLDYMIKPGDLDYKDVEIVKQTIMYEDCHGSDGTDPSRVTVVMSIVDANGDTHEIMVPKTSVREVKEESTSELPSEVTPAAIP
jgi:hypothetical protein